MLYFVKDNTLHRFPVPKRCRVQRDKEPLRDTIPHGVEECAYCMLRWSEDDQQRKTRMHAEQSIPNRQEWMSYLQI